MGITAIIKESAAKMLGLNGYGKSSDATTRSLERQVEHLEESLGRLQVEIENEGYRQLTAGSDYEFNRYHLEQIIRLATMMAIKNPIICRTVNVQADYVFGRGVTFVARHPMIQAVVDEFTQYGPNQHVLFSHMAMAHQERQLQVTGNLFLVLITNPRTGRVIVQDIDAQEVPDIIRNPQNRREEWFIKRVWSDEAGGEHVTYYPALGITETSGAVVPDTDQDKTKGVIEWNSPVYHIRFNYYGYMKFGLPEVYPSLDWALAYKKYLENWSSIMASFSRLAMRISGLAGRKQVAAAKSMLETTVNLNQPREGNPSAAAGGFGLFGKNVDAEPIKTAGATTPAKEGQPLLNMAAAGSGIPNTFYGDASVGNYATATTLDRPTELKMVARQRLWQVIFGVIFDYVVFQSAQKGDLRDQKAVVKEVIDVFSDAKLLVVQMPINDDDAFGTVGEPISASVAIKFPELLERNVTDRVRALVNAVTLFGKTLLDIIPDKRLVARMLLEALNVENIDVLIPQFVDMWEKNLTAKDGKPVEAIIIPPPAAPMPGLGMKPGGGGAVDPSQGGAVGANG